MKPGDRVKMTPMWKYDEAYGHVKKTAGDYIVIIWEGINGEWHYTPEQAIRIEVIKDES